MREVIFKNLTSFQSRKKDIFLQEVFEKDGVLAKTERRCFYFIKNVSDLGQKDAQKWLDAQNSNPSATKKHFYIFKEHSDAHGEDRLLCKIAGTFYAVVSDKVYTIGFLHSFRVRFLKETLGK